jgi:hypothetical protein
MDVDSPEPATRSGASRGTDQCRGASDSAGEIRPGGTPSHECTGFTAPGGTPSHEYSGFTAPGGTPSHEYSGFTAPGGTPSHECTGFTAPNGCAALAYPDDSARSANDRTG